MKKGFIAIFILFGIAFLAITFLKQSPESVTETELESTTAADSARTSVINFWDAYDRATDLRTAGEYDRALPFYRKALSINPGHQNSLYYHGNLLLRSGRFREAEESWKKLKRVNPSSARAYSQLGTLYSCREPGNPLYNLEKAADHFAEAARLNREETGPLLQLAKIDLINRRYEQSGQQLDDVIASNFRSTEALFLKGFIEWKRGRNGEADSLLHRSLSIVKGTATAKNVGEGDTEKGSSPLWSGLSRCNPFSGQMQRLLEQADPAGLQTDAIYRSFAEHTE